MATQLTQTLSMEGLRSYPRSLGGMALLLLRFSVGLLLLGCVRAGHSNEASPALTVFASAMCIGLTIGILTPVLCGIAFVSGIVLLCCIPAYLSLVSVATLLLCASTMFLGAGAYSVDGLLFGRRRVIL